MQNIEYIIHLIVTERFISVYNGLFLSKMKWWKMINQGKRALWHIQRIQFHTIDRLLSYIDWDIFSLPS